MTLYTPDSGITFWGLECHGARALIRSTSPAFEEEPVTGIKDLQESKRSQGSVQPLPSNVDETETQRSRGWPDPVAVLSLSPHPAPLHHSLVCWATSLTADS